MIRDLIDLAKIVGWVALILAGCGLIAVIDTFDRQDAP